MAETESVRAVPEKKETNGMKSVLDEYLKKVRTAILLRAAEIRKEAGDPEIDVTHVSKAVGEHSIDSLLLGQRSTWREYFPPVALMSAILAFAFACLGLWAILGGEEGQKLSGQGFLDIAKILAGAIVGSTTAAVATTTRKRSRS